jgi:hypothetical protein
MTSHKRFLVDSPPTFQTAPPSLPWCRKLPLYIRERVLDLLHQGTANITVSTAPSRDNSQPIGEHSNDIINTENNTPQGGSSQASNSYLNRRESELNQDDQLLKTQIRSVTELLEQKTQEFDNYGVNTTRQKHCSLIMPQDGTQESQMSYVITITVRE